jgi:hypothetical protein
MNEKIVRLSARELAYLQDARFLPDSLVGLLVGAQRDDENDCQLTISRNIAEQFRSAFTEQVARVGFDANYEPTGEGKLLEELIDRFYV